MRASLHQPCNMKPHWLLTLMVLPPALLGLSIMLNSAAVAATSSDDRATPPESRKIGSNLSAGGKTATSASKKSHRLIRRPNVTTNASTTQPQSVELSPTAPTTSSPAPSPPATQENAPTQLKETGANKSVAPLASPLVGQMSPTATTAPSALIGSAAPSTRAAAATSGAATPNAPASMRRLFAEIPGVAQIAAYEDLDLSVATPTISRNPATMSFSTIQNGAAPTIQALMISNSGTGTLSWTASSNSTWLTINGTASVSGSNTGSMSVGVNPSGLTVGAHNGVITILGTGVANSPQTVNVTLDITAAPTPTIGLSATSLSFSSVQGGSNPANKTVSISNSGSGTLNWTATESTSWLSLTPASGTGGGTITVSVVTTGMTAGTYSAPITIAATGATNTPQTVTVSLTLTAPAAIGFSPASMGFTATQGGSNPAGQALTISNTGGSTLSWTVSDDAVWLTPSPASGTGSGSSTISINTTGLSAGAYSATITISANGATNTPRTVPVTLTIAVAATPTISRSPATLTFTATQGGANPTNQTIAITNSGTGTLSWTASDNAAWLSISPSSGTGSGTLTAVINTSGLATGSYSGTITITASGATNTPQTVAVNLTVTAPSTSSATLTWNANGETDLASYNVYRTTTPGVYGAALANIPAGTVSYLATGLQIGTTYYFTITAVDSSGNESLHSNEVSKSIF